jgi:hypothetical protein
MAKHILNLTFHIQNNFVSLSPVGWFLLSLFPVGLHENFSLQIGINISQTIHITAGA